MIVVHKIRTGFKALRIIENWFTFALDYFGLIDRPYVIFKLRTGIQYKARARTRERHMITDIWIHQVYTKEFDIEKNDIVVDIGANIGVFSVFASYFAKNGTVYAFEPEPESFELLRENAESNNMSNIRLINKAVSARSGKRDFYVGRPGSGGHTFCRIKGRKITVQTISLEDFFKRYELPKLDFLKMDCEGAEYEILFNCPRTTLAKIKKISMEYHDIDRDKNGNSLKKFLENNGFTVKKTGRTGEKIGYLYAKR